mgnify:FL=1
MDKTETGLTNDKLLEEIRGIRRVVINRCYGGFSLSDLAEKLYRKHAGITDDNWYSGDVERDDSILVSIVRELGAAANGSCANLKIVEIPAEVEWQIEEYDGREWVAEKHRIWS